MKRAFYMFASITSASISAYNLEAHGLMANISFDRSDLANPALLARIGLDRLEPNYPFNNENPTSCQAGTGNLLYTRDAYIDAIDSWNPNSFTTVLTNQATRCPLLYEQRSMPPEYTGFLPQTPQSGAVPYLRARGWLMRGVIREDDFKSGKYDNPNLIADRDPWNDDYRSKKHFYEPISDASGLPAVVVLAGAERSAAWALGLTDNSSWAGSQTPNPLRGNHFSYYDARKQMFLALTLKVPSVTASVNDRINESRLRLNLWATTFKSLGHVIHLLQDTASPQHVRGELHAYLCNGSAGEDAFSNSIATRTYENFSNYRVTVPFDRALRDANVAAKYSFSNFCDDEKWRRMFDAGGQLEPLNLLPWDTTNTYPIPQFSVQRKFFTTRVEDTAIANRRGLADYTNRGFFTEGAFQKNAGQPHDGFASPPPTNDPSFVAGVSGTSVIPGLGTVETQSLYWKVPDVIAPTYADRGTDAAGRAPVVSESMWQDTVLIGTSMIPTEVPGGNLTLDNYTQISDMAPPRAIAYSAGLINFFFRGKIAIEVPVDGLFAATDHSIAHTVDADGYPRCTNTVTNATDVWCTATRIYGFTKLRLKIRNDTAPITESGTNQVVPQTMVSTSANPIAGTSAGLYAVARYHRNPCYKPDLSGERTVDANGVITEPSGCANGTRTAFQEISVSAPKVLTAAELNSNTATAVSFNFVNDPIPINATDLQIQVVYRGQLGAEVDGIAVGSYDVKEPSYVTMWNNSDWGACNGAWVFNAFTGSCLPNGQLRRAIDLTTFCVGSQIVLSQNYQLHGGRLVDGSYLRVAVLLDDRLLQTRARTQFQGAAVFTQFGKNVRGQTRQSSKEIPTTLAPYVVDTMYQKRGRIGSLRPILVNVVSGADAQPSNDQGPLDVGNLLPSFLATDLPNAGDFQFPDTPVSVNVTCPGPQ